MTKPMDLVAHALYGATLCSESGVAGGRRGAGDWRRDSTVFFAALMGIAPDISSMGVPFVLYLFQGMPGHFFREFDGLGLTIYRYAHSLLFAALLCSLIRKFIPRYFKASLAWPLHILLDAPTHGAGRFQTTLFYPLSEWGLDAIRWWEQPGVIFGYWLALPILWTVISRWRTLHQPPGEAASAASFLVTSPTTSNKSAISGRPVRRSRSTD